MVGVEDGGFSRESGIQKALLVSVLLQGISIIDFQMNNIKVDGLDATEKLITLLRRWSFDSVILAGVSFAGFNLIDAKVVFEEFETPVIIVARTKPNNVAVKSALLHHFEDWKARWGVIEKLGPVHEIVSMPNEPPIYTEIIGADLNWAGNLIRKLSTRCRIPEPIRVARLVAQGLAPKVWKS
ncbi:MAG: DUF99 family protein [Candidatus Bathyarchaeia archaeon]